MNGYLPLCVLRDGPEPEYVGLNEMDLDSPVELGGTGTGFLRFAPAVSDIMKSRAPVGSEFDLAEGRRVVGSARVLEVGSWEPAVRPRRE